jgi:hypothetical protein
LRTVIVFAGLNLHELTYHRSLLIRDVTTDGFVLGFKTKTRLTLTGGGDSTIEDE